MKRALPLFRVSVTLSCIAASISDLAGRVPQAGGLVEAEGTLRAGPVGRRGQKRVGANAC
jgi:hypothetical protein